MLVKSILVTGGAGFIGSNFIVYFMRKHNNYYLINLDKLTYAGNLDNIRECENIKNYTFVKGDICDKELVEDIFCRYNVQGVIHFAAESHVDNSIFEPKIFIDTNIVGTFTLLEVARRFWIDAPYQAKQGYEDARFHHVSTDEVYGALGKSGYFNEETPYAPNSPYSASKASSDHIVRAYHNTYGINVTTSICSNNYGPKQHVEKLIPAIIKKCINEEPIPIYGTGDNIRDWLHVLDHCKAIDLIFHKGRSGEVYNVGGHNELENITVVRRICRILDRKRPRKKALKYEDLIRFVSDRPGHDYRYAIDSSKLEKELGWKPVEQFEMGIEKTIDWYLA